MSRRALADQLRRLGHRVREAVDGEACLSALRGQTPPDLALLDIDMPKTDGMQVLAEIRREWTRVQLPVIMVTGMSGDAEVVNALAAGANDYVVKPICLPVLLARVSVWLGAKRQLQALLQAEQQRVMVESLGAACHHLSQPMTPVVAQIEELMRKTTGRDPAVSGNLRAIRHWIGEVSAVIHRLQDVNRYRTVPYTDGCEILDIRTGASGSRDRAAG